MLDVEYDLTLSGEQLEIRDAARGFADDVLRPAGLTLDRLSPEQVIDRDSVLFGVLRLAHELGFTRLRAPVELGGLAASPATQHLVLEELARGSVGLAGSIFLSAFPPEAALASGRDELVEEIARPHFAAAEPLRPGAWAITEPGHGSDMLGAVHAELRVPMRGGLIARREGDRWILRGQKSAWVSNGPIAEQAVLNAHVEPNGTSGRGVVFVLPLDLPGVSRGRPLDKHGVRSLPQGEIFFDDVLVPSRYVVAEGDAYPLHVLGTLTAFNAAVSCLAVGLARAAYETALAYAKERVQGGRPIVEHQSVRARLFRAFSLVRASRALSRDVYVYNLTELARGGPGALEHSIAAKVFCTDAALEVATLATQIHGGAGMMRESPVETFLRDAAAFTIADGENGYLAQVGGAML